MLSRAFDILSPLYNNVRTAFKLLDDHVCSALMSQYIWPDSTLGQGEFDFRFATEYSLADNELTYAYPKHSNSVAPSFRKPAVLHRFSDRRYHMTLCDYPLLRAPYPPPNQILSSNMCPPNDAFDSKVTLGLYPRVVMTSSKTPHNSYMLFCQEMKLSPKKASPLWKRVPTVEKEIYKKRVQLLKEMKVEIEDKLENVLVNPVEIALEEEKKKSVMKFEKPISEVANPVSDAKELVTDGQPSAPVENESPKPANLEARQKKTNALLEFRKSCGLEYAAAMKKWKSMKTKDKDVYKLRAKQINEKLG